MPWISKELYNKLPRVETLKAMSLKELLKLYAEYRIPLYPEDDKADMIKEILLIERELKKVSI